MYIINMRELHPFWERAKKLIKAHKITQEKFAAYVGINFSTFRNWICYGITPDLYSAYDIAVALGVSMEYLVTGNDGKAMQNREEEILKRKDAAKNIKKMAIQIEKDANLLR